MSGSYILLGAIEESSGFAESKREPKDIRPRGAKQDSWPAAFYHQVVTILYNAVA
jgi:hypothetical protein